MKGKLIVIAAAAMLLSGCGDESSSSSGKAETSAVSSVAESSESTPSQDTGDIPKIEDFEYKDMSVNPYEVEKQKFEDASSVTDEDDTFSKQEDFKASIWADYYKTKYGIDSDSLFPTVPEGATDLGGGLCLDHYSLSYGTGSDDPTQMKVFTVTVWLDKKYDSADSLYDEINADKSDLTRDGISTDGETITEHFSDSIYFEYKLDKLSKLGYKYEISSVQKTVEFTDIASFAQETSL